MSELNPGADLSDKSVDQMNILITVQATKFLLFCYSHCYGVANIVALKPATSALGIKIFSSTLVNYLLQIIVKSNFLLQLLMHVIPCIKLRTKRVANTFLFKTVPFHATVTTIVHQRFKSCSMVTYSTHLLYPSMDAA